MKKERHLRTIIPLFCMILMNGASIGFIMPELGPMLLNHTAASIVSAHTSDYLRHWYYGITLSLPVIFMFIGSPLWGAIADAIGRKTVLLIALLGIALSTFCSAMGIRSHLIVLLLAGQALLGLMDGSEGAAQSAMADISEGKNKALNMSLITLSGALGFVIGPLFGGYFSDSSLVSWFNYQTPFYFAAILALLNLIAITIFFKDPYKAKQINKPSILQSLKEYSFVFKSRSILQLSIIFLCVELCWALYFQSISLALVEWFHYSTHIIGLFLTGLAITFSITLTVVIRILLRYLSRQKIVLIAILFILFSAIIETFFHEEIVVWLTMIPATMGIGLGYNVLLSLFSDAADETQQGRVIGLSMALAAIAFAISAIAIGLLSSINLSLIFGLMVLISIIALWRVWIFNKKAPNIKSTG